MANMQIDPLQSIVTALRGIFVPQFKDVLLGWPDTKFFEADGNLPVLIVFPVGTTGNHMASTETVHATVVNGDGTSTAFKEKKRLHYMLQLSVFAYTPEDRSNLGWIVQQYFDSNPQMQMGISGVETAMWKFSGMHEMPGETKFYQRDYTYEVSARVLDAITAPSLKTPQMNDNIT